MADSLKTKTQNQAFLKQLDKQRLHKPCHRVIDLRGKVAGECQAYQFGGKTHFLDDRAYLLAKQLLDRFNGHYTLGVYESLLKALKTLDSSQKEIITESKPPILRRSKNHIQFIPFDSQRQRQEPRIVFATPIEIYIADVLYHASTINITTSALRIALKRSFTLHQGDIVSVSFPELSSSFVKIPYTVMKISHSELHTTLVLSRHRHDDLLVSEQLDKWSQEHNSPEHIDLDNELFNLASQFYLRLYCQTLNKSLLWLDKDRPFIHRHHLTAMALDSLKILFNDKNKFKLSSLPIQALLDEHTDYLVLFTQHNDQLINYVAQRNNPSAVHTLIQRHEQQKNSQVLLLQLIDINVTPGDFKQEISALAEQTDDARAFEDVLSTLSSLVTVTNITASFKFLNQAETLGKPQENKTLNNLNPVTPSQLQPYATRDNQRFFIKTEVNVIVENDLFTVLTNDVSETGVSLSINHVLDIASGRRIKLEFIRWQKLSKTVHLENIPFIVRNKHVWEGVTHLGLERDTRACAASVNQFFSSAIELNKDQLVKNNDNVILSNESAIFTSLLTQQFETTPIFLGTDHENKRILQAVTTSEHNHAHRKPDLWLALQEIMASLSERIKRLSDQPDSYLCFGLYCYLDNKNSWQISTDFSFNNALEKSFFIKRAQLNRQYHFFHCSLSPLSLNAISSERDLCQQLTQLRNHSQHKVKQIREILSSLFAAGELNDITDTVANAYLTH